MRQLPLFGIEDVIVPKMGGVVSDFIDQLLTLEPANRPERYEDAARYLEELVLDGTIEMREHGPSSYLEISYREHDNEFPLYQISSMVSEITPIVLFLRYLVRQGDLLLIEEPESHLHPESQLRLARVIVHLVGRGVQVGLTTHSDYFLQQLNNSIVAATVNAQRASDAVMPDLPTIEAGKVSAYLFEPHGGKGTSILPIKVTPEEGISDSEFFRVTDRLYEQTVRLDRQPGRSAGTASAADVDVARSPLPPRRHPRRA